MLAIITLVAPVFGLIAIGWGAARIRYVPEAAGPLLSEFAYKILIPALLFRAMATMAPPAQSPWLLAGTYATAVLLVWLTATLATLILLRRPAADAPAIAFATTFGNGLMLGIPLILSAFGPEAATPVAILVTCDSILLWMLGTLHMELALRGFGGGSLMQVARTVLHLVRNPIIAAVIIGTLWRWSGLALPGVVDKLITLLAGAANFHPTVEETLIHFDARKPFDPHDSDLNREWQQRRYALGIWIACNLNNYCPASEQEQQLADRAESWFSDIVGNRTGDLLLSFFADRLKVHLREKGARHDLIDAVFALSGQDDLALIVKRVEALDQFLKTDDGANLLVGVKRASNILSIEEKKDKANYTGDYDLKLLKEKAEVALAAAIEEVKQDTVAAINVENFTGAMNALAELRKPVDDFFDQVTVNADDPALRKNRLHLLSQIRAATLGVADFSKIAG